MSDEQHQQLWDAIHALNERMAKVEAVAHTPQPVVAPAEVDSLAARVLRLERTRLRGWTP